MRWGLYGGLSCPFLLSASHAAVAQGVSPRHISDAGHSRVFTMQTYAHVLQHVQRDVATKMVQ
jgi:hypothetical protein